MVTTMDDSEDFKLVDFAAHVWTADDTKEYLDANPLPAGFTWKHKDGGQRPVQPTYGVSSYGKWLRETPNFQGLFEEIHRTLAAGSMLPSAEELARTLLARWPERRFPEGGLTQKLF